MMRQIKGIRDQRRHHRAADHAGDQDGILSLSEDAVREHEKRRNGAEGQPRRHQERRVYRLPLPRIDAPKAVPRMSCAAVPTQISVGAVETRSQTDSRLATNARPTQTVNSVQTV